MTTKSVFRLVHDEARRRAAEAVKTAPEGYIVSVSEPTRGLEQNAALWAILAEISANVDWYGRKLTPTDWKNVFSASLHKMDVVPNLDSSGFVALGQSTSTMSKREFSDLLELANAFAAERIAVAA